MLEQETGKRVPPFDRDDHRWMILHQDEWPQWPRLPIKQWRKGLTLGYIAGTGFATEIDPDQPITIVMGPIFIKGKGDEKTYPNLDALLDDGWVVD